jgi:hypothetical protein
MRIIIILLISSIAFTSTASAQGCVAIKSSGGFCTYGTHLDSSKWNLNINNRYFKSFRHFKGADEQKQRVAEGSEVINHAYTLDLFLVRKLKNDWSVGFDLPIISNTRSSLYEHAGTRHSTHSFGLGDMRVALYKWIWNTAKMPKGNIQVGAGVKLPTGDYKYQDFFYKADGSTVLGPVDQSIQLGDGGTGITLEVNSYYNFTQALSVYGNFYYLSNPREQNGVLTTRGSITPPSATQLKNLSYIMSVPDQYMYRAGVSYMVGGLNVSAGIRKEGLPSEDLIGGSNGFRRPGKILSIEPGVNYQFKKFSLYAYVPVAIKRERPQSVPDKITTKLTGNYTVGDAAFADYAINIGCNIKF